MPSIKVKIDRRTNRGFERKLAKGVENGIMAVAKVLYDESQRLVPVETGALKESGGFRQEGSGLKTVAVVYYGAPGFARMSGNELRDPQTYAVWVHQIPTTAKGEPKQYTKAGTQAFYLYTPLMEKLPEMAKAFIVAYNTHVDKTWQPPPQS